MFSAKSEQTNDGLPRAAGREEDGMGTVSYTWLFFGFNSQIKRQELNEALVVSKIHKCCRHSNYQPPPCLLLVISESVHLIKVVNTTEGQAARQCTDVRPAQSHLPVWWRHLAIFCPKTEVAGIRFEEEREDGHSRGWGSGGTCMKEVQKRVSSS